MKCRKPFLKGGQAFGCGQCLPCRIKVRREWTHRILLEACLYKESSFVTLTYAKEPEGGLSLDDYQKFLKRFRVALRPFKLRFYGVGEYGARRHRAHYHFVFFGVPANDVSKSAIAAAWSVDGVSLGFVDVQPFLPARAAYIAGYVIDKLTDVFDERLCGLNAEFSTKSLKPGLGHGMVVEIAKTITRYNLLSVDGDVPVTIAHGGRPMPLGRYLRNQVRLYLSGRSVEYAQTPSRYILRRSRILSQVKSAFPVKPDEKREAEMSLVRARARADAVNPSPLYHLLRLSEQEIRNTESRFRNFSKRKKQL